MNSFKCKSKFFICIFLSIPILENFFPCCIEIGYRRVATSTPQILPTTSHSMQAPPPALSRQELPRPRPGLPSDP